ncbi:MAG TPA: sugar ABC transporter permease [Armatimonadota bacterium]|jgi:multiple sugar transport system permease protein
MQSATPQASNRIISPTARRAARRRLLMGLAFVSPWLLGFLIFTLYPVIASFRYSLTDFPVLHPPRYVGFENYRQLLTGDEYFWRYAVFNTVFMFLELPLGIGMGLALATLLNQRLKGMAAFRAMLYLPSVVPAVASAMLWMWIFNPQYGLANSVLAAGHIHKLNWLVDPRWSKPSLIIMDVWSVGGGMIITLAALQGVPKHLYEAATLDGASALGRFRHVTIPMISPVLFFQLIMGVIGTFQYFTNAQVMTKGGPQMSTTYYAYYLFNNAFVYFKMGYACAMAWILFAITLSLSLLVMWSGKKWVHYG